MAPNNETQRSPQSERLALDTALLCTDPGHAASGLDRLAGRVATPAAAAAP